MNHEETSEDQVQSAALLLKAAAQFFEKLSERQVKTIDKSALGGKELNELTLKELWAFIKKHSIITPGNSQN